ncbi:MAG TPA: nitroreductase family protein, partial [Clostridia bacterium]|nr:nitroreductase family protein [Clostridia bacterium]
MDVINRRRSIRKFINQPVESEKIEKLLIAAMQAPSAKNQQPWEFIVVDSRKILDELAKYSNYANAVLTAPVSI